MKVFRIWFLCLLVASLLALPLRAPTLTRASNGGFSDVGPDHWAYEAITWLSQQGILTGYPDGTFRPNEPIKRSDTAILLTRVFGTDTVNPSHPSYTDVPTPHYAYPHIEVIKLTKLMDDTTLNQRFRPDEYLTRIEFVPISVRALGMKFFSEMISERDIADTLQRYIDRSIFPTWSRAYLAICVRAGIMNGFPDRTFRPSSVLRRAEMAQILYSMLKPGPRTEGKTTTQFMSVTGAPFRAILSRKLAGSLFEFKGEAFPNGSVSVVVNSIPMKAVSVSSSGAYLVNIPLGFIHLGEIKFQASYRDSSGANMRSFDFYSSVPFDLFPNEYRLYGIGYDPINRILSYDSTSAAPMYIELLNKTTLAQTSYDIKPGIPFQMRSNLQTGTNNVHMILTQPGEAYKLTYGMIITVN
ncbi:MAG TPA: S-layer homology domain-containing protein [Caldisericia bacterium]|nr:S-layer homology domain-containing protein [Caldisericia bacterium]